jgi:hypothetical protein
MNKQDLLNEGKSLSNSIKQQFQSFFGDAMPNGFYLEEEQRYCNWLELVQKYVYENKVYPEQYEEFKQAKNDISPENHKKILAIINSLK